MFGSVDELVVFLAMLVTLCPSSNSSEIRVASVKEVEVHYDMVVLFRYVFNVRN